MWHSMLIAQSTICLALYLIIKIMCNNNSLSIIWWWVVKAIIHARAYTHTHTPIPITTFFVELPIVWCWRLEDNLFFGFIFWTFLPSWEVSMCFHPLSTLCQFVIFVIWVHAEHELSHSIFSELYLLSNVILPPSQILGPVFHFRMSWNFVLFLKFKTINLPSFLLCPYLTKAL